LGYEDAKLHGAGRLMVEWTKAFDPQRVRVTACILREGGEIGEELKREGTPITFFGDGRFNPISIFKFMKAIRRDKIDVLHLQAFGASTFGRIAGLLTRTPTIVHSHACYTYEKRGYPLYVKYIDRLLAPFTDRAIAISQSVKDFCVNYQGFKPEQVQVVHNPVPQCTRGTRSAEDLRRLRSEYRLEDDVPVAGAITRFYPVKGTHYLIEAFAQVVQALPRARLLLVGDGPDRAALERQARELGIAEQVTFAGFERDVEAHLQLCWVSVVPSIEEGLGLAAIESMAAGVPVVASRVGGLPEVVTDGVTGRLVPRGGVDETAQAILQILGDDDLRKTMGDACRADSRRFSMERYVERMELVYSDLTRLKRKQSPRRAEDAVV